VAQERKVVCVATWGDPCNWLYAKYVASGGQEAEAFSTVNILQKVERPAKIVIVALDTLATYRDVQRARGGGGFGELQRSVEHYVKKYLCGADAEVVVLPGVLDRRERDKDEGVEGRVIYESDPRAELLPLLLQVVLERALEVEATDMVLDVSHGMNFMPTLALKAVEEAAAALAAARASRVGLRVYQSDPYPTTLPEGLRRGLARSEEDVCKPKQSGVEPPILRYNLILERTFMPWHLSRYTSYRRGQKMDVLTDWRSCDDHLKEVRGLMKEWALPILGAFRLGALIQLALLAKAAPVEELERTIKLSVECWERRRTIQSAGDRALKVASGTKFDPGLWALIHARAVLNGARKLLELDGGRVQELKEATVTLRELKRLREVVKGSKVVDAIVGRELSKLDNLEKERAVGANWRLYAEVLGEAKEGGRDEGVFKRDFIAHAGFHSEVIGLRLVDGGLEAKVRDGGWEKVKEVLREVVLEEA
jgi:CRISPR-associated protein Csx1